MRLSTKLTALAVAGVLLLGTVSVVTSVSSLKKAGREQVADLRAQLTDAKREKLKNLVEVAYGAIVAAQAAGALDDAARKILAKNTVKALRYGKAGYYWINDTHPTMVMHPIKPQLEGKDLSAFTDKQGKKLFVAFVDECRDDGEGFVDYLWPKPGQDEPVGKLSYVKRFAPWGWIVGTGVYIDDINARVTRMQKEIAARISGQLWTQVVLIAVITLLTVILSTVLARRISRPITNTTAMLRDIAEGEGDLTRRLEVESNDELGEMASWFNTFVEKVQAMIRDVADHAGSVTTSSQGLSGLATQMSGASDDMFGRSNTVAAAEEMSSNMGNVATAMEEATTNLGVIATAVDEMTSTIKEIAQNTEKASGITGQAVEVARSASVRVDELGEAAQLIGKVTDAINEISEQTKLLALNATIEAARAGEAGKGFAVVAGEIKDLARQTAEATGEIRERVEAIQGTTAGTVEEIGQITTVIEQVNEIVTTIASAVEEQSATTRDIAENVSEATRGASEVNENVAQSATVSGDIAREIADVNQSANEISDSSTQVNVSADEMHRLAGELDRLVGRFKV